MGVEDAARYIGVGRTFMYEMLRDQAIPSFTIGRLRKIRRADLDEFLEKRAARAK